MDIQKQFHKACENGNLEEAKLLLHYNPTFDIFIYGDYPLFAACYKGHLHIAKWIYSIRHTSKNIKYVNYNLCFIQACVQGHLEIAKWLLDVEPTINVFSGKGTKMAFDYACEKGQLEIAQWLFSLNNNELYNVYTISELNDIFKWTFFYNRLHVAKWLYSICPEINIYTNFNFIYACQQNHLEAAQWLCELNSDMFFIEIDEKTNKIIKWKINANKNT